jgi:short-subunit dehydrogenase
MPLPAPHPDRTCLVTGASSGIGEQIARQLASRGFGVTLVARTEAKLQSLAEELGSTFGIRAEYLVVDLADETARAEITAALALRGLVVNVLVNNAGFSTTGPVSTADPARELAMVRTDVEAVVHLCVLFVPGMVERRSGAVLNVASTVAFQPLPGQAGYAASKAFVLSYTHSLRGELRPEGVTVTALCPGPVDTGFAEAGGFSEKEFSVAPSFLRIAAQEVAAAGIAGMDANKAVVIPGLANRIGAVAGWLSPRSLLVPMLARHHPALSR